MLKIGKGGVIDSLQMQKIVKLLLISGASYPKASLWRVSILLHNRVTCYSPAGRSISVNCMFLKQFFKSADHLLNNSNKSGCGYVLGGVFSNSINPRILQVTS